MTTPPNEKLKPCPLGCKGSILRNLSYSENGDPIRASILCAECLLETGTYHSLAAAENCWNNRPEVKK